MKLTNKELPDSLKHHEIFSRGIQVNRGLLVTERKLGWMMIRKLEIEGAVQPVRRLGVLEVTRLCRSWRSIS